MALRSDPRKRAIVTMPFHTKQDMDKLLAAVDKYATDLSVSIHDRADIIEWFETYVLQYKSSRGNDDFEYVQNYQSERYDD